jgi:hypothetical protein
MIDADITDRIISCKFCVSSFLKVRTFFIVWNSPITFILYLLKDGRSTDEYGKLLLESRKMWLIKGCFSFIDEILPWLEVVIHLSSLCSILFRLVVILLEHLSRNITLACNIAFL